MKTTTIALLVITVLIRTVSSLSHLDDDVPREKAKKPKLTKPTQLPEVTHRVYLDVGEFSKRNRAYNHLLSVCSHMSL